MTTLGWVTAADRTMAAREITRVLEAGMAVEVEAFHSRDERGARRTEACDRLMIRASGREWPLSPLG